MSSTKLNILFTGATGYIGGSVLSLLLDHPDFSSFNITARVRSAEKAEKLRKLGINVVVGSHDDGDGVSEKLASESDVVIAVADADNLAAARATLRGLKKRYEATSVPPVFIHTELASVLTDDAKGMYATETIYDDLNPDQIETLPPTQLHRNVDLELLNADKEGYVRTYIIVPSTIWGIANTKLVKLGVQNPHSIQIPQLIKAALGRGQGGMVGDGKNIWPNVNVDDVADLYVKLLDAIRSGANPGHGREGFYFGENGEHRLYDIGKRISEVLVELGRGTSPEVTTFTKEELDKYLEGTDYLGTNSRCRGNRSRSLGWKPTKTAKDMLESIKPEVQAYL